LQTDEGSNDVAHGFAFVSGGYDYGYSVGHLSSERCGIICATLCGVSKRYFQSLRLPAVKNMTYVSDTFCLNGK